MFEKFTEKGRKVVINAREEAEKRQNDYLGTEHLLLGLLKEEEGLPMIILKKMGIRLTVEVPDGDPKLWSYDKVVREFHMQDFWVRAMRDQGGRSADWFVYMGVIPIMWVGEIWENPDVKTPAIEELPEVFTRLEHPGSEPGKIVDAQWTPTSRDEFFARIHASLEPWNPVPGEWGVGKSFGEIDS